MGFTAHILVLGSLAEKEAKLMCVEQSDGALAHHPQGQLMGDYSVRYVCPLPLGHKTGYVAFVSLSQNSFLSPPFRSVRVYEGSWAVSTPSLTFIPNLGSDPCQQGPWKARVPFVGQLLTRAFPLQRREEPVHHSQRGVWSWQDGVGQVCHALLHHSQWLGQ